MPRRRDWADDEAERLFDMVRAAQPDEVVIEQIALALRQAKGVATPPNLTRAEYDRARSRPGRR